MGLLFYNGMDRVLFVLLALVLAVGLVGAQPLPPSGLKPGFDPNGIFIEWQHSGGEGIVFRIYRGATPDNARLLASTEEHSYLDRTVESGQEYWYFITAADATGESIAVKFNVKNTGEREKPFTIALLEPTENTFAFGEEVEFVVEISSEKMSELEGISATLSSNALGFSEGMSFDSLDNRFYATVKMPSGGEEGLSADVKVLVRASFEGEEFSEPQVHAITIVPERGVDTVQLALNFFALLAPWFVIFAVVGAGVVVWGVWSAKMKGERDLLREQLLEAQKEEIVWKHDFFKRRISAEQFKEKSGELQGKVAAIEEKLGVKHAQGQKKVNVFEGFSPMEAQEVMMLVKSIGKPKKGETMEGLRARLVGLGKGEKVAKKVSSLVFGRRQG